MKILCLAAALLFAHMVQAQAPVAAKDVAAPEAAGPLIADVHPSPYRATIYYRTNIGHQRFDVRDATLLDIISVAYDKRDSAGIIGGPTWIDFDRFDIAAGVPSLISNTSAGAANPANPYNQIRPVLQRVLTERFGLTYHTEDRSLPAYTVTVAKEGAKLTEAKNPEAPGNCAYGQDKSDASQGTLACTSQTIGQFLTSFGGNFPHPVIDRTGLKKTYDFSLKVNMSQVRSMDDFIRTYIDILNKQLGLTVVLGEAPQPAMVVDKLSRTPSPTSPEVARLIPAPPDLEFEVATIKPAAETEPQRQTRQTGSQMTFTSFSLQELLVQAFDLPTGAMLGNRPDWLDHVRYTMLVKLPPDLDARTIYQDRDQLDHMLQRVLVDRFQIKYHWGEQTLPDAFVLLPSTPKMKKADPESRSFCKVGPPDGEKDVRSGPDSPYDREFHCQNVSMAQFADLFQSLANSEVKTRVPDKSGIAGSYDFTVYYTTARKLRADTSAAAETAKQAGDAASTPVAGMSMQEAFRKQLGLRIERQPVTLPALVLDKIEQTPTDN